MDRASFPGFLDESEFKCRPDDFARGMNECAKLSIIRLVSLYFLHYSILISTCATMYDVWMIGLSCL